MIINIRKIHINMKLLQVNQLIRVKGSVLNFFIKMIFNFRSYLKVI